MADIIIDTDNIVEVLGLTNSDTGAALTTATVLVSLYDTDTDQLIAGQAWPHTLTHDVSGNYRGNFSDALSLAPCMLCRAEFSIDDGPGLRKEWESLYDAVYGSFTAAIFIDNSDNTLTLDGLSDDVLPPTTYINGATVQVTLSDLTGAEIAGQIWPATLLYEAASNGKYEINLTDTLDVTDGDVVKVLLTADNGANQHREWRSILTVQTGV